MSHPPPRASLLVTLSDRLYRLLLAAYPAAFRHDYGEEMARVFRDACRAAVRRGGPAAVPPLWPPALLDLAASALAERSKEGIHMSRSLVTRAGAVAAMLGAVLFLTASLVTDGGALGTLAQALGVPSVANAVLPTVGAAGGLLFALALVGLLARVGPHIGGLGWLGAVGALIALVAEAAALYGLAWGVGYWPETVAVPVQREADLLFCAAMIVLGIAVLRARPLPTGNWIPLAIGLLSVLSGPADLLGFVQQSTNIVWAVTWGPNTAVVGNQRAMALGLIGRILSLYVLLAVGAWFALGFALWRRGSANAPAPGATQPAGPAPTTAGPTAAPTATSTQPTPLTAPAADSQPLEARLAQAYLEGYRAAQRASAAPAGAPPVGAAQTELADLGRRLGGTLGGTLAAPGSGRTVFASLAALIGGGTPVAVMLFHLRLGEVSMLTFALLCGTAALVAAGPFLASRAGRLGMVALRAAQAGMIVGLLTAVVLEALPPFAARPDVDMVIVVAFLLAAGLVGAGMVVLGLLTLRRALLPRWSFAPLLIGILTLAGLAVAALGLGAQLLPAPEPRLVIDQLVGVLLAGALILWAAAWLALGVALWPRRAALAGAPAPTQASAPLPA